MKSIRLILGLVVFLVLISGTFLTLSRQKVTAIDILPPCQPGSTSNICKDNKASAGKNPLGSIDDPILGKNGILAVALNVLSYIGGLIAVFTIIISGIGIVTSGGDANNVKEKRTAIMYALGGLVIVLLAQVIVRFVLGRVII